MTNNLAKIIYRNTADGKIEILRFENVLTAQELEKKFGKEVTRIYLYTQDKPAFKMVSDYIFCRYGSNIGKGILTKDQFVERIIYLKKWKKNIIIQILII